MQHSTIFRKKGVYGAFPILNHLPDGRLTIGFSLPTFHDHYGLGEWTVLVSTDEGESWAKTDDPATPQTGRPQIHESSPTDSRRSCPTGLTSARA